MQTFIKTTLAAALSIAAISPALADEQQIVVQSTAAFEEWQADVTRSLDRRLANADRQTRTNPVSGIVQLRFTLDGYGVPHDFDVVTSSGDRSTDLVAKRAVRGLNQLSEAPVLDASGQTFQANIVFASNADEREMLTKKLAKMEQARLARSSSETSVISFGL